MLVFVVDDESLLLSEEAGIIGQVCPDAEIRCFQRGSEVLTAIEQEGLAPDVVFCDIQMPGIRGLELAVRIRSLRPRAKIIFVTGYEEFALDAYRIHAHGYLLKPLTAAQVSEELSFWNSTDLMMRSDSSAPESESKATAAKLQIRCFGQFEVFWNGAPLSFDRRKTKELLAYLIDKEGASCTSEEISTALWEEEWDFRLTKNRIRVLVSDLKTTLERIGMGELLIRRSGRLALRRDLMDCDYYRLLEGDPAALNSFDGQYMLQYPWAELTTGRLYFRYIDGA